jgi:hypothetical protein
MVRYIAFYDISNENRECSLAAKNKVDYICSAITKHNYLVEIISPSWTNNAKGYYKGYTKSLTQEKKLKIFSTFGSKSKIGNMFKYIYSLLQLFLYLLFEVKKDEPVIVYHSVMLFFPIRLAQIIKRFKVILEVEEVYQDIQNFNVFMMKIEYKAFNIAEKYLFSTELLNDKLNKSKKPFAIVYGTYQVEKIKNEKFNDGKVHVVYAGTFDPKKFGAATAVNLPLSSNYHIHILGFGKEEEIIYIKDLIKKTKENSEAAISYEGLLKGEDFINFLQKCHIGLSTQIPEGNYNESSFPSKILSYLSNGLNVVTVKLKVLEVSSIKDHLYISDNQTTEAIASSIMSVRIKDSNNSIEIVKKLDKEFTENIKQLLGEYLN